MNGDVHDPNERRDRARARMEARTPVPSFWRTNGGWLVACITAPLAIWGVWTGIGQPRLFNPCAMPTWAQVASAVGVVAAAWFIQGWWERRTRDHTVHYRREVRDENGEVLSTWTDETTVKRRGMAREWIETLVDTDTDETAKRGRS